MGIIDKKLVEKTYLDSDDSSLGTRNENSSTDGVETKEVEYHTLDTELPEKSKLNEMGVPIIGGVTGNKLLMWITFTASMGFGLFGVSATITSHLLSLLADGQFS